MTRGPSLTYEERMRRAFNLDRVCDHYVAGGVMTRKAFDRVLEDTIRVRGLMLDGLDWLLFDQLLSACREVPLLAHYEALSAGLGRPFEGIETFYDQLIELQIMSPVSLNRTIFYRVPDKPGRLGELLVELGLIDEAMLQRAVGIKTLIGSATGTNVAIGQVFRSLANLSVIDFFQALSLQVGIPFESLGASAPAIFEAAIRRPSDS